MRTNRNVRPQMFMDREWGMFNKLARRPSDYALQVWTLVARRGMPLAVAAKHLDTTIWRIERIIIGVSRRNAGRWR